MDPCFYMDFIWENMKMISVVKKLGFICLQNPMIQNPGRAEQIILWSSTKQILLLHERNAQHNVDYMQFFSNVKLFIAVSQWSYPMFYV